MSVFSSYLSDENPKFCHTSLKFHGIYRSTAIFRTHVAFQKIKSLYYVLCLCSIIIWTSYNLKVFYFSWLHGNILILKSLFFWSQLKYMYNAYSSQAKNKKQGVQ